MTIHEWAAQVTGLVLKIPAGTVVGHRWYYQYPLDHETHPGEWSTSTDAWRVKIGQQYRPIVTGADQYVELRIDAEGLVEMARKATTNKSRRSSDGPLTLKGRK
jgi:hypothetical protein